MSKLCENFVATNYHALSFPLKLGHTFSHVDLK